MSKYEAYCLTLRRDAKESVWMSLSGRSLMILQRSSRGNGNSDGARRWMVYRKRPFKHENDDKRVCPSSGNREQKANT